MKGTRRGTISGWTAETQTRRPRRGRDDEQPPRGRRSVRAGLGLLVLLGSGLGGACSPTDATGDKGLPPNIQDPSRFRTPAGAMALYRGMLASLPGPLEGYLIETGVLTDELTALPATPLPGFQYEGEAQYAGLDSRQVSSTLWLDYYALFHRLRARARETHGFLAAYVPDSSPALRGHAFALEGYAEVFLADLFCSGIPLSTVDFDGDYTLRPGSTTHEVYAHAVALFDSATALFDSAVARGDEDSTRLRLLAAVGRGRALLGQGRYAEAQAAVSAVPNGYAYQVEDGLGRLLSDIIEGYQIHGTSQGMLIVADREGVNGLDYRSSADPRIAIDTLGTNNQGYMMYFPATYPPSGVATLTLASGVEARLIAAEAALQAGSGEWLATLNALRTDGTYDTQPTADQNDDPAATDTLWRAGTGGVAGLKPLVDPGGAAARLDLVFRERAFWLYLTGHRQGDLRRRVREYGRAPETVYPTGAYSDGLMVYGNIIALPVPASEQQLNPKYTGCQHLGA